MSNDEGRPAACGPSFAGLWRSSGLVHQLRGGAVIGGGIYESPTFRRRARRLGRPRTRSPTASPASRPTPAHSEPKQPRNSSPSNQQHPTTPTPHPYTTTHPTTTESCTTTHTPPPNSTPPYPP